MSNCAGLAATGRNDLPMLKILVGAGARVDGTDDFGYSPLSTAKDNGYDGVSVC
jgi:hypothetical protein